MKRCLLCLILVIWSSSTAFADRKPDRIIPVWPELAPGESTRSDGTPLPRRPNEDPPATRIKGITRPLLELYLPHSRPNGTMILVCPGGGYNYVVRDKEGSEAAEWLNRYGVSVCVLRYRTKNGKESDPALRPLQDAQRAVRLLRHLASEEDLPAARVGILGFSAGGQLAALATTASDRDSYPASDEIDAISSRPDFCLLIYPWRLVEGPEFKLRPDLQVTDRTPPCFLVHAHDDSATSMSSVMFYAALRRAGVESELHIYRSGGHGYGMRPVGNSEVDSWPDRATEWLRGKGLLQSSQ